MTNIRETAKSWIVEQDGYCEGYGAYVQGNVVCKIAVSKSAMTREQVEYYVDLNDIGDLINVQGYRDLERRPGVRVLEMRRIQ